MEAEHGATFRFVPEGLDREADGAKEYLNDLNETLLRRLNASGEVYLSNAVIDGTFALRACIVNFRTSRADVEAVPGIVVRHGLEVDRTLVSEADGPTAIQARVARDPVTIAPMAAPIASLESGRPRVARASSTASSRAGRSAWSVMPRERPPARSRR